MTKSSLDTSDTMAMDAAKGAFAAVMGTSKKPFADRERDVLQLASELARDWLQTTARATAASFGDEVVVSGLRYRRHATGRGCYHSLCGRIEVQRDTYRLVGQHNGPTVVPLELALGIRERATPALVHSVVQGFAAMPSRTYQREMEAAYRVVPSGSTAPPRRWPRQPDTCPIVTARTSVSRRCRWWSSTACRTSVPSR